VANIPFRVTEVKEKLTGMETTEKHLAPPAKAATHRCKPLPNTRYKVPMAEASVLEALDQAVANKQRGRLCV
jgi:xanthine dehydrogenase YagS FAD-binding subunit